MSLASLLTLQKEVHTLSKERVKELIAEVYQYALGLYRANNNSGAETTVLELLTLIKPLSDLTSEKAYLYRLLANLYNKTGDFRKSLINNRVASEYFMDIKDYKNAIALNSNCGALLHYLGDHAGAYEKNLLTLRLAENKGLEEEVARILLNTASLLAARKDFNEALELIAKAESIFVRLSHNRGIAHCFSERAEINLAMGNINESLQNHKKAFEIRKEQKIERELLQSYSKVSSALIKAGQPKQAMHLCLEGIKIADKSRWPSALANVLLRLAEAQLECELPTDTLITINEANKVFALFDGYYEARSELKRIESKALKMLGKLEEAYSALTEYLVMESERLAKRNSEAISRLKIAMEMQANQREKELIEKKNEELIITNNQLVEALAKVDTLSGMLPICASCKRIRDDDGYWQQIESYISNHSSAEFSHSLCTDCMKKLYPEVAEEISGSELDRKKK